MRCFEQLGEDRKVDLRQTAGTPTKRHNRGQGEGSLGISD